VADGEAIWCGQTATAEKVNAGWLLLEAKADPTKIKFPDTTAGTMVWKDVEGKVLLITPRIFAVIVNSNLEVRTSVSINPETGAAEDKLLFTYEAIPRGTWLCSDLVVDDYSRTFPTSWDGKDQLASEVQAWSNPLHVATGGLRLIEYLGVGGMGTRGFGRMALASQTPVVFGPGKEQAGVR
jgi:CRISPR-associated protein Cmr4